MSCSETTESAARVTQISMTRLRPKRRVAGGAENVPITPPTATAAVIHPTTSGPKPRAVSSRAVRGRVLPTPTPSTATLEVTATKSRHKCLSSMEGLV